MDPSMLIGIPVDHIPLVASLILILSLVGVLFGAFSIGGDP